MAVPRKQVSHKWNDASIPQVFAISTPKVQICEDEAAAMVQRIASGQKARANVEGNPLSAPGKGHAGAPDLKGEAPSQAIQVVPVSKFRVDNLVQRIERKLILGDGEDLRFSTPRQKVKLYRPTSSRSGSLESIATSPESSGACQGSGKDSNPEEQLPVCEVPRFFMPMLRIHFQPGAVCAALMLPDPAGVLARSASAAAGAAQWTVQATERTRAAAADAAADKAAVKVSVLTAAGGAALGGTAGAAVGATSGGTVGALVGIVGVPLTFGLSVPVGAAIGSGTGFCVGAASGGTFGCVSGGVVGFIGYRLRHVPGSAFEALQSVRLVPRWG